MSPGVAPRVDQPIRSYALGLPLELERLNLLDVDVVANEPVCEIAEQDLLRARGLLQARRNVHGVARDEALPGRRIARDDLPRVHAGSNGEPHAPVALELVVQHGLRPLHPGGRPHGPQGVVFVELRKAEHGHDRVADELLDHAAVPLQLRPHCVEVARHHLAQGLGVELLAHRRRALEIGEDDGHDFPELLRRRRFRERRAARQAELGDLRVVGGALRADGHATSLPHPSRLPQESRFADRRSAPSRNVYAAPTQSPQKGDVRYVVPDE